MGRIAGAAAAPVLPDGTVAALCGVVGRAWLLTEPAALRAYECDGLTGWRAVPLAVVLPGSTEEVAAVVRILARDQIPFVARGAGTGLSGGALPCAEGVVIGLSRMRLILGVDLANERVTVQPGVTNLAVTEAVAAHGYRYAPDPSSQQVCTIGGNVAENAGGAHCLKLGFTTHHVVGATLVRADGTVVRLGGAVLDPPGYDALGVVVGSEGTLGIVTEVVLRVVPAPAAVRTLVAAFASTAAAGEAVAAIIAAGVTPAATEMMDRTAVEAVEAAVHPGYPPGEAVLLVELDGSEVRCAEEAARVLACCRQAGATACRLAADPAERARLWRGRKAAFAAMGRVSSHYYVQDGVIPRTRLAEVLEAIHGLELEFRLRVANVFHAGDGNLHPLVLYDDGQPGERQRAEACATRILDACLAVGGSLTGEHGVGRDKACLMPKQFSVSDQQVMHRLRRAFDPAGLCNPGKVLPTPRLCGEVPGIYRPHPVERAGLAERW